MPSKRPSMDLRETEDVLSQRKMSVRENAERRAAELRTERQKKKREETVSRIKNVVNKLGSGASAAASGLGGAVEGINSGGGGRRRSRSRSQNQGMMLDDFGEPEDTMDNFGVDDLGGGADLSANFEDSDDDDLLL